MYQKSEQLAKPVVRASNNLPFSKSIRKSLRRLVMQARIWHTENFLWTESDIWCWNTTIFKVFDVWGMTPLIADCLLVPRHGNDWEGELPNHQNQVIFLSLAFNSWVDFLLWNLMLAFYDWIIILKYRLKIILNPLKKKYFKIDYLVHTPKCCCWFLSWVARSLYQGHPVYFFCFKL